MTPERPNVKLQGRYDTTQAAALLGVHRNTIRDWANKGLLRCGWKKNPMRRFFTGADIIRRWEETL